MNFCIFTISLHLLGTPNNDIGKSYIENYYEIAIVEMNRTGIPASIKLAQGLLESDWGRSDLANNANNHFGIKCGNGWNGPEFYKEDDDLHSDGSLMASCFRKFESPTESYIAHSNFLTDSRKSSRYGFLFQLDLFDYKSWAKGLKDAGYATDPSYPEKLIAIIEKYQLYKYDSLYTGNSSLAAESSVKAKPMNSGTSEAKFVSYENTPTNRNIRKKYSIESQNNARYIITNGPLEVRALSEEIGISTQDLISYNETLTYETELIPSNSYVYLEMKDRDFKGSQEYHKVKGEETMAEIAQQYGVRLSTLLSLNRLSANSQPLFGEKISLKKKIDARNRPKCKRIGKKTKEDQFLFDP